MILLEYFWSIKMSTVRVRKQGGAAIVTLPSDILKKLDIHIGSELELTIDKKNIVAHPIRKKHIKRSRYTLQELLRGVTPKKMKLLKKETKWIEEGEPVGHEIT
jgi:antitoxin ChpS